MSSAARKTASTSAQVVCCWEILMAKRMAERFAPDRLADRPGTGRRVSGPTGPRRRAGRRGNRDGRSGGGGGRGPPGGGGGAGGAPPAPHRNRGGHADERVRIEVQVGCRHEVLMAA